MDVKKLVEARKEAEKAVAQMEDGQIKVKAFEVILAHLLSSSATTEQRPGKITTMVEPKASRLSKKAKSASARVLVLRDEGFFRNQRSMGEVTEELAAHGWHYPLTSLSGTLQALAQRQELRRVRTKQGSKKVWLYSEP